MAPMDLLLFLGFGTNKRLSNAGGESGSKSRFEEAVFIRFTTDTWKQEE